MVNISTGFIGLDLGDRRSHLVNLDPEGELIEETSIPTTEGAAGTVPGVGRLPGWSNLNTC